MPAIKSDIKGLGPALPVLLGAAVMLSLSMGLRQCLGLFMPALTRDVHISVSDFTLAIAIQNLTWGVLQPFTGALTARFGFRPIMVAGSLLYVAGLLALMLANGLVLVIVGAGVLIGVSLACTAMAIAMSVSARAVSPGLRSTVFGLVSAAGSIGGAIAAPIGQVLQTGYGWRYGVLGFVLLACVMIPAAWFAGRADAVPLPPASPGSADGQRAGQAAATALRNGPFMVMATAYFVCGMQLLFVNTHLPSYLAICGMDPMLSAEALGMIGGFNVLGCLFFGWAGGRWNKLALLGTIYLLRSAILVGYFIAPPTTTGTLLFAGMMGFLWLGVGPLVAGATAEMFGLRWQAMIQGIAFVGHQVGSFVGAFGGGVIYDALGSYDLAWKIAVATGLVAGAVQVTVALVRPTRPPMLAAV